MEVNMIQGYLIFEEKERRRRRRRRRRKREKYPCLVIQTFLFF